MDEGSRGTGIKPVLVKLAVLFLFDCLFVAVVVGGWLVLGRAGGGLGGEGGGGYPCGPASFRVVSTPSNRT